MKFKIKAIVQTVEQTASGANTKLVGRLHCCGVAYDNGLIMEPFDFILPCSAARAAMFKGGEILHIAIDSNRQ